ncbi:unnamed protein product [Gongylonema pulchrum]|uniref:Transmembrane protein 53 n=1 Tax=Gongylonema pulchrum TaxID=637853 RepID=A0A183DV29_9BILA|nr:unnamed protein product [Gongylonema pulchrum]
MDSENNNGMIGEGVMRMVQHSNPQAALVFLFGWAGCSDRYLTKYAKIYEKDFTVVRFTADIQRVRSFASYRQFALDIYEKILETSTAPYIYCHMFSMNGCSTFCALWDLLDTVCASSSSLHCLRFIYAQLYLRYDDCLPEPLF